MFSLLCVIVYAMPYTTNRLLISFMIESVTLMIMNSIAESTTITGMYSEVDYHFRIRST